MSAYIVCDECVQVIATAIYDLNVTFNYPCYKKPIRVLNTKETRKEDITEIAKCLVEYNYISVNYRYNESTKPHKFNYTDGLKWDYRTLNNCIGEYDYQACEPSNYYESDIYKNLERLKEAMREELLRKLYGSYTYNYNYDYEIEESEQKKEDLKEEKDFINNHVSIVKIGKQEAQEDLKEDAKELPKATKEQEDLFNDLLKALS